MFNPNDDGIFDDHLSATDRGVTSTLHLLLALYAAMALWAAYSVWCNASVDIPLMLVIQKMACIVITTHIVMYSLLAVAYKRYDMLCDQLIPFYRHFVLPCTPGTWG